MTVLNWQTDPIYFDVEDKPVNQWINANELIESNHREEIFLNSISILNLFPILVRRADFVRENHSDRILARLPFVQLTEEEKEFVSNQDLLVAEKLRDYFYQSDNRKILEWRDVLRKYLERGAVPLPFYRCFPEDLELNFHERILESSRGETFGMPTTLTNELAYLCGMVNGDGSLTKYVLNIIDYSIENIRQLKEQFERLFRQTGRIQMQTENSPALIITNLWVVRFFSFLTDQPIGGKKYQNLSEPLLLQEQPFRSHYWSGVMDADGSYANGGISFTSASKHYAKKFSDFLESLTIKPTFFDRPDNTFRVYIPRKFNLLYKSKMFSFHPEKRLEFQKLKEGREKKAKVTYLFQEFNQNTMRNNYFDFSLMIDIQVTGLGEYLKETRNNLTQHEFAQKIDVSTKTLQLMEKNRSAISLNTLEKILLKQKKSLMQFLMFYGRQIQFRRFRAPPVFLDYRPSNQLKYFAKKMLFFKNHIRIDSKDKKLNSQIENHFGIKIENNVINNGVIRYFFKTFCNLTKQED